MLLPTRIICLLLTALLCTMAANAQTTPQSDTTIYYTSLASTGTINKTNTANSYLFNNSLKFSVTRKNFVINTFGGWIYGRQQAGLTNNDYSSSADFNLLKKLNRFYYWGLVTYDKSYSLKINNRVQAGIGVGFTVVNKPKALFVLSDGPLSETSKLYDTSAYQTVRNSFRIKYSFLVAQVIVIDGTNFLQNSLFDGADYIIKANNNISLKLNNWLSVTASTTYNRVNLTRSENLLINFGLRVEKTF